MGRIPKAEKEKAMKVLEENQDEEEIMDIPEEPKINSDFVKQKRIARAKQKHPRTQTEGAEHGEKKKLNRSTFLKPMIEHASESDKKKTKDSLSVESKWFNKFSNFVRADSEQKKAKINSVNAKAHKKEIENDHTNDDCLLKFFALLQENKISLDIIEMNKKKQQQQKKRLLNGENKVSSPDVLALKNILGTQSSFNPDSLIPYTFYSNLFTTTIAPCDRSNQPIFSLLNDKIYQIYNENTEAIYVLHEKVRREMELNNGSKLRAFISANNKRSTSDIITALLRILPNALQLAVGFGKHLPGLNELNAADFSLIIEKKIFDYFMISNSILFIDGESYMYITEDVVYTRYWQNMLRTKEVVDPLFEFMAVFNPLNLTKKEKALLIALIFTMPAGK
jgi:hypothetical protein